MNDGPQGFRGTRPSSTSFLLNSRILLGSSSSSRLCCSKHLLFIMADTSTIDPKVLLQPPQRSRLPSRWQLLSIQHSHTRGVWQWAKNFTAREQTFNLAPASASHVCLETGGTLSMFQGRTLSWGTCVYIPHPLPLIQCDSPPSC